MGIFWVIHSFNIYLLCIYYVPDTFQGSEDTELNKMGKEKHVTCPHEVFILVKGITRENIITPCDRITASYSNLTSFYYPLLSTVFCLHQITYFSSKMVFTYKSLSVVIFVSLTWIVISLLPTPHFSKFFCCQSFSHLPNK